MKKEIEEAIQNLIDVIQYSQANLDNSINTTDTIAAVSEGDSMPQQHRMRVVIGYDEHDNPIIKRVAAFDELSLADKVIESVVKSGRINEFLGEPDKIYKKSARQSDKITFADYIVRWRNTYKRGLERTTQVFLDAKQSVLVKWFGNIPVRDIKPAIVQDFITERAKKYKRATVKADLGVLKEVLDSAVSDGLIETNPAKDPRVKNTAKAGAGTAALSREQVIAIQKAIPTLEDDTQRCLIALLAYTSMRREEVLGLMWDNIDFERRVLEIKQAVVYPEGAAFSKSTKNRFSVRTFPMGQELYDILLPCAKPSGYVISGGDGKPITAAGYKKLWKALSANINLYGMTAINFRTTFCTMMVASGVDIKTAQALMGHATPDMTLKVYTKQEESRIPDAIEKVSSFLSLDGKLDANTRVSG